MTELVERLRASAYEVASFPHPSHCDHLHDAPKVMREAADFIERAQSDPWVLLDAGMQFALHDEAMRWLLAEARWVAFEQRDNNQALARGILRSHEYHFSMFPWERAEAIAAHKTNPATNEGGS